MSPEDKPSEEPERESFVDPYNIDAPEPGDVASPYIGGNPDDPIPVPNSPLSELSAPEAPGLAGIYVSKSGNGALIRIESMDEFGARIVGLDGKGRWTMTRAEYDEKFDSLWRPATPADLAAFAPPGAIAAPITRARETS
jgi:hypothetical protein